MMTMMIRGRENCNSEVRHYRMLVKTKTVFVCYAATECWSCKLYLLHCAAEHPDTQSQYTIHCCICCTVLRNTLTHSHSTRYTVDTLRGYPALIPDQSMKDLWWVKCYRDMFRISPATLIFP